MVRKETRGRPRTLTKEEYRQNQRRNTATWNKNHSRCINIRFSLENDKDVLEKIDSMPNKAEYIRNLIRNDIKNGGV